MRSIKWIVTPAFIAIALLCGAEARAEVTKVDVISRSDVGQSGYETIVAKAHFAIDPKHPRNAVIADIDKAPRNAAGRVEFAADLFILRPKTGGNGVALVDIVNRGNRMAFRFSRAASLAGDAIVGDGFLTERGFTVVSIGWEFDVPARDGALRIDLPVATDNGKPITGIVRAGFTPNRASEMYTVGDLAAYAPVDPNGPDSVLTVRDGESAAVSTVPRDKWHLSGNTITLTGGFEPGRNYELAYKAANPPIGGLGFAAVRDVVAWAKHGGGDVAPVTRAIAFGLSQSGRFLRTFMYLGFNSDEQERLVLDGVMAHISGAARIDLNRRWATPTGLATYAATAFPFADAASQDPVSGATEGLLDNARSRKNQPKIFYTNTGVEYWGGGRSAALVHTSADGTKDLVLPNNVRAYFLTGAQHTPGVFPPTVGNGQQKGNPLDYWWTLRALLVAMDKWVKDGTAPPASQYPRLDRKTLVPAAAVAFPTIPDVQSPRTLTAGVRSANSLLPKSGGAGAPLPFLIPQVNADGNELAGIRLPDVAVPLATYTGWNFRNAAIGGTKQLFPLVGSYIPLARTKAEREARHDPRPSIAERYASRQAYLDAIEQSAAPLVKGGYLLAGDVPAIVSHAGEHWGIAALSEHP